MAESVYITITEVSLNLLKRYVGGITIQLNSAWYSQCLANIHFLVDEIVFVLSFLMVIKTFVVVHSL